MAENLLALAVKPLDVATPLLQARRIQQAETETQQAQFNLRQTALGSEARGLLPYVNHPEFGSRWGEAVDRLAQSGHLDPQRAAQIRNSPSPLVLQQLLAQTSSMDQMLKMQQMARTRAADAQFGPELHGGAPTPSASMLPAAPPSTDPTMGPSPRQVAEVNGLPSPVVAPAPQPNSSVTFGDGVTMQNAPPSSPIQTPQATQAQPAGVPDTNDLTREINKYSRIASNPDVSQPLRDVAKLKLTELQKQSNDWSNYRRARASGDPAAQKPFTSWLLEVKRAGAPPAPEKKYDELMAKVFTDYNKSSIEGAQTARTQIGSLARLKQLLASENVYQGTGGNFVANLKRIGASIGIDTSSIKDGAANADAIRSIANQIALQLRNPAGGAGMPGALSDKDREFLQSMVAGLTGTPAGNKLIIDYGKRVAQRSIEVENLRQRYVQRNGRLDEGFFRELAQWSEQNPLFSESDVASATQNQSAQNVPSGTTRTRVQWRLGQ